MSERRTIGQILHGLGRVTQEDIDTALEYQRDHGGYFGEALQACGFVTQEEVEFGIASQFDLPYVVPDPDSIDLEAAALVSPEWALTHSMLPILKTGEDLRVVTDSPMREDAIEELEQRTGLAVQLSLCASNTLRDLIRSVYAKAAAGEEEPARSIDLRQAMELVGLAESSRFGVSVRGPRARFWWEERGSIRRRGLAGDWRTELDSMLSPSPAEIAESGGRARWAARLTRQGTVSDVMVDSLSDESGQEIMFSVVGKLPLEERFPLPADGILSEVRLLARSGTARFIVRSEPDDIAHDVLPHLPALLLDPTWRSIYINAGPHPAADEAFSVRLPADAGTWGEELAALRAFHFDVVTVDLGDDVDDWAEGALDIASVAFLYWPSAADTRNAYQAGIRWALRLQRGEDGLQWSLDPLNRQEP